MVNILTGVYTLEIIINYMAEIVFNYCIDPKTTTEYRINPIKYPGALHFMKKGRYLDHRM